LRWQVKPSERTTKVYGSSGAAEPVSKSNLKVHHEEHEDPTVKNFISKFFVTFVRFVVSGVIRFISSL